MTDSAARVAILTGASSGIGYALAERMKTDGWTLVIGSRRPEAAVARIRAIGGAGDVVAVPGDLANPQTAEALIEAARKLGPVQALFLNHSGPAVKRFEQVTDDEWTAAFRLMVLGPLRLLHAALPLFREAGGGRVVAITSFVVKRPVSGSVVSSSLRAVLVNAIKTVAQEAGPDGILLNAVAPGYIATERLLAWIGAQSAVAGTNEKESTAAATNSVPLRRFGQPEAVAELVAFLLSPRNTYITGQQILIDGGLVVES